MNRGYTKLEQQALRIFHGMRVLEATAELIAQITPDDIRRAVPGSPTECVAARCLSRATGGLTVVILRTVAMIEMVLDTGEHVVYRYMVPPETLEKVIRPTDERGRVVPGVMRFVPPRPAQTLDGQAETKRRNHARRREAQLKGEIYQPKNRGRPSKRDTTTNGLRGVLRDGAGMIQMRVIEGAAPRRRSKAAAS